MPATLERPSAIQTPTWPAREDVGVSAEWPSFHKTQTPAAAIMESIVSGGGGSFVVDVSGVDPIHDFATSIRTWLLVAGIGTGGSSATVAPSFLGETYPAMLALVASLDRAGAGSMWRPDGPRTIRLGEARHVFVSADRPVPERTPPPDSLLEVVDAHRLSSEWFDSRVAPRAGATGLTTVFYGLPGATGSVYERELQASSTGGPTAHFTLSQPVGRY